MLAFGRSRATLNAAGIGAGAAAVAVGLLGVALHRPLQRVPENALKLLVGIMLSGIGAFWFSEGIGVRWWSDAAILLSIGAFALGSAAAIALIGNRARLARRETASRLP